jgi:hypothetical protein
MNLTQTQQKILKLSRDNNKIITEYTTPTAIGASGEESNNKKISFSKRVSSSQSNTNKSKKIKDLIKRINDLTAPLKLTNTEYDFLIKEWKKLINDNITKS